MVPHDDLGALAAHPGMQSWVLPGPSLALIGPRAVSL